MVVSKSIPEVMWETYQAQSRSLGAEATIVLPDRDEVIVNLALLATRAPSLAKLMIDSVIDLRPSGLSSDAVRAVIDFVHSDRQPETTDLSSLVDIWTRRTLAVRGSSRRCLRSMRDVVGAEALADTNEGNEV